MFPRETTLLHNFSGSSLSDRTEENTGKADPFTDLIKWPSQYMFMEGEAMLVKLMMGEHLQK